MKNQNEVLMPDVVLDANVLADFLAQFFSTARHGYASFEERETISRDLARRINRIVRWHDWSTDYADDNQYPGKIIASTFAFVEIARKWNDIAGDRFTVEQIASFIEQPPEWFVVEPVDENLVLAFCDVPTDVLLNGELRAIEWADAIHIATAFGRGDDSFLAATDEEIRQIEILLTRLI